MKGKGAGALINPTMVQAVAPPNRSAIAPGWRDLVVLSDAELGRYDVMAVNLACAADLPGLEQFDVEASLRTLDEWAEWIRQKTRRSTLYRDNPAKYDHSESLFRVHVLTSVLQRDFGVRYNPACIPVDAPLCPVDVFLPGILQGNGGSCASPPVLYTAVGRRIGYRLKLVRARQHLFLRWHGRNGECFNIEQVSDGFATPSDDYYRTGRYQVTPDQEREGCLLKSMTPREELAEFLAQRAYCWLDFGNHRGAAESFIWASVVAPENKLHATCAVGVLDQWGTKVRKSLPPNFPEVTIRFPPRRIPYVPDSVERDYLALGAFEDLLLLPENQQWWEALRHSPTQRPAQVPERITVAWQL
jgi:hypothetical protein